MKRIFLLDEVARARDASVDAPTLPFSDTFERSNGALGSNWIGETWALVSSVAANTPSYDASLFRSGKGVFDSGTESWAAGGSNTISNDAGELKIVYVNNDSGATLLLGNATDFSAVMSASAWYRLKMFVRQTGGSFTWYIPAGAVNWLSAAISEAVSTEKRIYFTPLATTRSLTITGFSAGEMAWLDNLALEKASASSLVAVASLTWTGDGFVRAMISVPTMRGCAGVIMSMDNPANPQNWVELVQTGSASNIQLFKVVAGVRTNLIATNLATTTGMILEIRRAGTSYSAYVNSVQIGTTQTISDAAIVAANNHGIIATEDAGILAFSMNDETIDATRRIAFVGGSITLGGTTPYWRTIVRDYLCRQYMDLSISLNNVYGNGYSPATHLIRYAEIIASTPTLIFLDLAVNSSTDDFSKETREALIRKLRADLPSATIAFVSFPTWVNSSATSPNNSATIALISTLAAYYLCADIDIQSAMLASLAGAAVGTSGWYTGADYTHPDGEGNTFAAGVIDAAMTRSHILGTATPLTGSIGDYARLYDSAKYEATLINRVGTDNNGETGTWSTVNTTERRSSVATSTISWTATCSMIGINIQTGSGTGSLRWRVDGGSWTTINCITQPNATSQITYLTNFATGSHTLDVEVVSGTITMKNFYAI